MQELSLNILDIVQNSIRAEASLIEINILEDTKKDIFSFYVNDNGCGMSEEMLKQVSDPFVTTRTTRKVGLGISLLKSAAQAAGGDVELTSTLGVGTKLCANFKHSHIDRQPLGDIGSVITTLITTNPKIDFIYFHTHNGRELTINTMELRQVLGDEVSLSEVSVMQWISEYLKEGLSEIYGGVL